MKLACGFARRRLVAGFGLAVAGTAVGWMLYNAMSKDTAARPLAVVVSADTAGWIIPCGCTTNQSGGLARRTTYIEQLATDADVIVADAGGAAGGDSAYDRLKFAAILSGEEAMGLKAHNLGASELSLGADECRRLASGGAPLISANTTDRQGKPIVALLRIVNAGGRRVALVGVVSPHFATVEIAVAPPAPAVLAALHNVAGQFDAAIVLAYLPTEELESLGRALPEVDVVVGGPTLQSIPPHKSGPTLVTSVTNKGKFLATLHWNRPASDKVSNNSGEWQAEIVEVAEPLADDVRQLALVRRFEDELAVRDFTPAEAGFAPLAAEPRPADFAVAENGACGKCHPAERHVWDGSPHHHAWQSLVEKHFSADPFCQRCHSNAYGQPGGFVSAKRTPNRVNVDCESCHGPASAHAADPQIRTPFVAREQCTRCHDRENSPRFVYDTYWPRIQHGSPAKKPGTEDRAMKRVIVVVSFLLAGVLLSSAALATAVPPPAASLAWIDSLTAGLHAAQRDNRTLLVVAGSTDCPWCEKLAIEFRKPSLIDKLKTSGLEMVHVDVDAEPAALRTLAVGPIPALRLMSPRGAIIASHDGYLSAEELSHWLDENLEHTAAAPPAILTNTQPPNAKQVGELIDEFKQSDPLLREAALRRLAPHPKLAAAGVSAALEKGNLATRLTALELLDQWHAPLAGLDPWRPETFTHERQEGLDAWAARVVKAGKSEAAAAPTAQELAAAAAEIARLADLSDADAEALCERLARFHAALLPQVIAEWKAAATDRARQRLLTLRYRLVASDLLMLTWPGGLARLASAESSVRHKAVEELVERASSDDQPLLLELFKDPDPLVREISLRGLQHVSPGQTGGALAALLDDPDPNVRAAVLKQLAEDPSDEFAAKVAAYASREHDPDLLVHALRYLKGMPKPESVKAAIGLLKHPNWQVRAEAVDALSGLAGDEHLGAELKSEATGAMADLMDDPEPFVVSRVFHGLIDHQINVEADRLEKAADKHPELAADMISLLLGRWHNTSEKDLAVIRTFFKKPDSSVRAAILAGLNGAQAEPFADDIVASLGDKSPEVRAAAGNIVFKVAESILERARSERSNANLGEIAEPAESPNAVAQLLSALGIPKAKEGETSEPAAALTEVPTDPSDIWLARFRKASGSHAWLRDTVAPLTKMLDGTPAERLASATALVALGERDDRALPMLKQFAHDQPASVETIARILPWLTWRKRQEWFNLLISQDTGHDSLRLIVGQMVVWPDARAAELLWKQLAAFDAPPAAAVRGAKRHAQPRPESDVQVDAIYDALRSLYPRSGGFGGYPNGDVPPSKEQIADLKHRAEHGETLAERVVALAILCDIGLPDAADTMTAVAADAKAPEELRAIAFRTALLVGAPTDAAAAAIPGLQSADDAMRHDALLYLAYGNSAIRDLGYGVTIYKSDTMSFRNGESEAGPQAPKGLKPEAVRPFLKDADPDTAAAAGYLLSLLGEPDGFDAVVRRWRSADADDTEWPLRVAAAASALDDPQQVPLLEEIYKKLSANPNGKYYIRTFYWTIRSMHGPAVLKLRKTIRDEVGMDNLR